MKYLLILLLTLPSLLPAQDKKEASKVNYLSICDPKSPVDTIYNDGQGTVITHLSGSLPDGMWFITTCDNSDRILYQVMYENGLANGPYVRHTYENGERITTSSGMYKKGQADGWHTDLDHPSGITTFTLWKKGDIKESQIFSAYSKEWVKME